MPATRFVRVLPLLLLAVLVGMNGAAAAQTIKTKPTLEPRTSPADGDPAGSEKPAGKKTGREKPADDSEGDIKTEAEESPTEKSGPVLPNGFLAARVKDDAPDDIKAFFAASDKARLAAIAGHRNGIAASGRKLRATSQQEQLNPDELDKAVESTRHGAASRAASIAALLKDVGYVPAFESMPQSGESKVLKVGLIMRFGRPVRVVRVLDKERALIQVEEQIHGPKRRNSEGRMIEPTSVQPVKAVVRISTREMKDGARTPVAWPLRVTGTEEVDGATVFVLEPFSFAEFLEPEPLKPTQGENFED